MFSLPNSVSHSVTMMHVHKTTLVIGAVQRKFAHNKDSSDEQIYKCDVDSLDTLVKDTKFSRNELKILYRRFKQASNVGFLDLAQFERIHHSLFTHGDSSQYAHLLFAKIATDKPHGKLIDFNSYIRTLSILTRGSKEEKLSWTFNLYDQDSDGFISPDELGFFLQSVYKLVGNHPIPTDLEIQQQTAKLFERFDLDGDSKISFTEFLQVCLKAKNSN